MAKFIDTSTFSKDILAFLNKSNNGFITEEDCKKMSEEELLEVLKKSPDFQKLVFPNSWYKKFDLPMKDCMNMKEFLAESPWMKRHQHFYTGKVEQIAAKPGGNRPILEAPEVPQVVLIQNSFSDAEGPKEPTANQTSSSDQQETLRL